MFKEPKNRYQGIDESWQAGPSNSSEGFSWIVFVSNFTKSSKEYKLNFLKAKVQTIHLEM
jgi:hypothetical protein